MSFSERYGFKPIQEIIQIDSIDEPLRNSLWSILKIYVWDEAYCSGLNSYNFASLSNEKNFKLRKLCNELWLDHFKKPVDQIEDNWLDTFSELRRIFFNSEWYEVYDFIEFVANKYDGNDFRNKFIRECNRILEKEVSAYRFVDGVISRITDREQIEEIELALSTDHGSVQTHLQRALELLSDRETPDYRNSIKESISAVESLVAKALGADKGTLGQLIKKLEDKIDLHSALKTAFSSLYGYTSDEDGIRHAILESKVIGFEDAKFFLVICSAFVNYVEAKLTSV